MKTIALKMNTYAKSVSIVDNDNLQRRVLYMMLFSLVVLALLYVLLLGNMVFNILERRTFEADARALSNEIGELELVYLSMSSEVDLNLGQAMGFKEIKPKFAVRKSFGSLDAFPSIKLVKNDL